MSMSNIVSSTHKTLERLVAPIAAELPLTLVRLEHGMPGFDSVGDSLKPRIAVVNRPNITTVRVIREAHVSEGFMNHNLDLDMYMLTKAEAEDQISEMIREIAKLLRDDAQMIQSGEDPFEPGYWRFTCQSFMLAAAQHWQWSLDEMAAQTRVATYDGGDIIVRGEKDILCDLLTSEIDGAQVRCTRTSYRRHLQCRQLSVLSPDHKTPIAIYSDQNAPSIHIPGHQLPGTVLIAAKGRKVGEIVEDKRLGPMRDLIITSAHNEDGIGVTFEVEDEIVPMGKKG